VSDDETAFNGRGAGHTFNITATTETSDGFDEEREWARAAWSALEPYHASVYVNFLMDEGEGRIRQAYGADKYERLTELKRRYDPGNLFRLNQPAQHGAVDAVGGQELPAALRALVAQPGQDAGSGDPALVAGHTDQGAEARAGEPARGPQAGLDQPV
jgi:hypothetical protein